MNNQPEAQPNGQIPPVQKESGKLDQLSVQFKKWGDLRDGFLILLAAVYGAGYLVWSFYASQNNLGLLPALDLQYFVAGIGPAIIFAAVLFLARGTWKLLKLWPEKVGPKATGIFKIFRWALIRIFLASFAIILIMSDPVVGSFLIAIIYLSQLFSQDHALQAYLDRPPTPFSDLSNRRKSQRMAAAFVTVILFALVYFIKDSMQTWTDYLELQDFLGYLFIPFILSIILLPPINDRLMNQMARWYSGFSVLVAFITFVLIGFFFYAETIYFNFPQELGGVRPRCAFVDAKKEDISAETLQTLFSQARIQSEDTVVRSEQLDVLFSSKDILMVKPFQADPTDKTVIELDRGAVHAVTWCD